MCALIILGVPLHHYIFFKNVFLFLGSVLGTLGLPDNFEGIGSAVFTSFQASNGTWQKAGVTGVTGSTNSCWGLEKKRKSGRNEGKVGLEKGEQQSKTCTSYVLVAKSRHYQSALCTGAHA